MGIGGSSTPSTKNVGTAFWHDLGILAHSGGDCQLSPIFSKYSQVSFGIFSDAVFGLHWIGSGRQLHCMSSSPLDRMISFCPFMPFRVNFLCLVESFSSLLAILCSIWTSSLWHYQQSLHPPDQLFKSLLYVRNLSGCLASNQQIHSFRCFAKGRVCPRSSKWTGWTTRAIERDRGYFATLPLSACILGCLLNGISQSSCRKPLREDWAGARGLFLILVCLWFQAKDFPKSRWTAVVSDWIVSHALVFLKGFCENQWHRDDLAEKTNRLLENPEVCLGLQPLLPSLGSCCRLSFSLESVAKVSLAILVLCIAQCNWDRGLCLPRGSDQIQFGSHFW